MSARAPATTRWGEHPMETKGSRGNPSTTVNRHRLDSLRMSTLSSSLSRASVRVAAVSLLAALDWACSTSKAAPPPPPATVAVVDVVKQDVPLRTEWVTTLDGYVNARIRPQVSGYLVKQNYVEGSYVKKDDVLFEIDP